MKILQINTEKSWRGGERQTLYCVEGLARKGLSVDLLARAGCPLAEKAARNNQCRVHAVRGTGEALAFLARNGRSYDILHAQTGKGQSLAVLTKVLHGRPVVYTRRVDLRPKQSWFTFWKYRRTDSVVSISQAIAEVLRQRPGLESPVIPSALKQSAPEPGRVEELARRYSLEGKTVLGTVAVLVPHKDPLTMVEAFAMFAEGRPNSVMLHFGEGPLRNVVERRIEELNLRGRYILAGFHDNVEDLYPLFDAFVMSSREEGLGSSVLDAFARGIPVVATQVGGLKELVEDRGWLAPPGDPSALARAMEQPFSNPQRQAVLSASALGTVQSVHSAEKMSADYIDLYARLVSQRPAKAA